MLNCGDKNHFIAECMFENKEENGGKLVRKDKSKTSFKKNFVNKNSTNKKPSRYVLVTQEEYLSGDEEEDDSPSEVAEVAAIATTSTPSTSLFESPNENLPNNKARCFMAKATEVSSPSKSMPNPSKPMMSDLGSLKAKEEVVALEDFISNLQGESKRHFETLMGQLGQAQDLLEEKEEHERNAANEIANLSLSLEEEQGLSSTLEESYNLDVSKLVKDRDHARALTKVL